jgi:acyl-CoA synthetase (AMP-forming)/AMP-acid ligase II
MPDVVVIDTVRAAIRYAQKHFDEHEAVIDRGRRITYSDLAVLVRRTAGALVAAGLRPRDRICVWAPNRLEWMLVALGAQYLGAVLVPLNTRYRGAEALDVLARTRARMLVVDQGFLDTDYVGMLHAAAAEADPGDAAVPGAAAGPGPVIACLPGLTTILDLAGAGPEHLSWTGFLGAATAADAEQAEAFADEVGPDDLADILFTSGTTGRSKGAMASHRQSLGLANGWADRAQLGPGDRYLIVNPFFHSFGYKAGYLACLLSGTTIVPQSVFDPGAVLELIERERITVLPGPPAIYQTLLEEPSLPERDLSSLRLAVTGAAMVPQTLIQRIGTELRIDRTLTAYGLTEAPVVTMCTEEDDIVTVATTCGRPLAWAEVRIAVPAKDTGREDPDEHPDVEADEPDGAGEVLVRGPAVMLGYLDDPEATAAAIDADGWLHTGDVGVLDERGYLRITDRLTDMFTVGGFNVYPAEVEQVISSHPAVRECAVIGVPDDRLGEVGRAYVSTRQAAALDADSLNESLIAYCRERLANFKIPRTVVVVDQLPRNAGGKVVKPVLRHRALSGQ